MIRPSDLDHKFYGNQVKNLSGVTFDEFRKLKQDETTQFLQTTLTESGGNKAEAARRLGITDNHLRHLLKG